MLRNREVLQFEGPMREVMLRKLHRQRRGYTFLSAVAVVCISLLVLNQINISSYWLRDRSGQIQEQVLSLSLQQQYELYRQRHSNLLHLFTSAQLQVAPAGQIWLAMGDSGWWVEVGVEAPNSIAGSTAGNSYFLDVTRTVVSANQTVAESQLQYKKFLDFVTRNGWAHSSRITDSSFDALVQVSTSEYLRYELFAGNVYRLTAHSGPYWGDRDGLFRHVYVRLPEKSVIPADTVAGLWPRAPSWDDHILRECSYC